MLQGIGAGFLLGLGFFSNLAGLYFYIRGVMLKHHEHMQVGRFVLGSANVVCFLTYVVAVDPSFMMWVNVIFAAAWFYAWWKNRRKGKRINALKSWGEKSKARIKAMVDRMTPSPIPTPVGAR